MTESVNDEQMMPKLSPALFVLAAVYFILEWIPAFIGEYGYFIDEFYFLECADHLAFGYVDHPPLSIFLLYIIRGIIGDSLGALRFMPALAGALNVLLAGVIARRLGAGTLGQLFAAGAVIICAVYQVIFSYYSMNVISILLWSLGFLTLIRIEQENQPRLWLIFGLVAGIGLLNKHTFVLFLVGLMAGMLLTPARRHLKSRWFWLGGVIALCLLLPNLIWQNANNWPSIEFYRNADFFKNVTTPPSEVLSLQLLAINPGALPVWLGGFVFLFALKRGRYLRHLGWIYIVLLLLLLIGQKSRPDRIAGAYIIFFAAGGTLLADLCIRPFFRWLRWAIPSLLVITGLALAPIALPLLPPDQTAVYGGILGVVPQLEMSEGKKPELPLWITYRLDWEQLVDNVEAAVRELDSTEFQDAIILVPTYGQAGAIELLGRDRGLPPVYATQNTYFHWGPPPDSVKVAIVAGPFSEETVRYMFNDVELSRVHDCEWCMQWLDQTSIWIARNPKMPIREIWPQLKNYI